MSKHINPEGQQKSPQRLESKRDEWGAGGGGNANCAWGSFLGIQF